MQNLVSGMRRRRGTAGLAAAAMMAGGLAGTVLLTPGTAFADTSSQVNTATSITASEQWNYPAGVSTVKITVSVTAQGGSSAPTGDVIVSTGPDTSRWCDAKLDQSSGLVSTGDCYIKYLRDGSYNLTASYAAQDAFASSVSASYPIAVGGAPVYRPAHLSTQLFCPRYMRSGQSGSCTLVVRNDGPGAAADTTAQISLPAQLRARWCSWGWVRGCAANGGTVTWHLGTVYGWQTKAVTVAVTARLFPQAWWQHPVRVTVNGAAFWGRQWWWQQPHASYTSTQVTIFRR